MGRDYVQSKYEIKNVVRKLVSLYENSLAQYGRSPAADGSRKKAA
jgi:hypothetical protein